MSSSNRQFKDAIYEQLARIGKSFGSGPRLEILDILYQGPRAVAMLAKQVGNLPVANTSHHLQVLRRARLVEAEKDGVRVTYRLADKQVCAFFLALRQFAESRLLEIEAVTRQFLEARDVMEPVDKEALIARVQRGEVIVLDVRPLEEYRAGHIPGALSVPLDELDRRMAELSPDREVVAYCRGPYCVLAIDAVARLRQHGYRAIRLEEGVPDWYTRGLPIESDLLAGSERPSRAGRVPGVAE